jgi:hypothetical protein
MHAGEQPSSPEDPESDFQASKDFRRPLPYRGPVVAVPPGADQGPDPLDEHSAPLAAHSSEPGLSRRRIQELADWYGDQSHQRYNEGTLDTAALDPELRAILR